MIQTDLGTCLESKQVLRAVQIAQTVADFFILYYYLKRILCCASTKCIPNVYTPLSSEEQTGVRARGQSWYNHRTDKGTNMNAKTTFHCHVFLTRPKIRSGRQIINIIQMYFIFNFLIFCVLKLTLYYEQKSLFAVNFLKIN